MTVFGRRVSPAILVVSSVLAAVCAATFASLALAAAGALSALGAPGRFLLAGFSWAAFFVPLYLLCGVFLLTARVFRRRSAFLLMFSIIPFLTLSLLLRVLQSPSSSLPLVLVDSFGVFPAALLLVLLLALEMIFLLTMPYGRIPDARRKARAPVKKPLALPLIVPSDPPAVLAALLPAAEETVEPLPPISVEAVVAEPLPPEQIPAEAAPVPQEPPVPDLPEKTQP